MKENSENIVSFKKLVWPYREKRQSGLLSIKVDGNEHLLNIYFELGMIVGLSVGSLKNVSCIDSISQCKPLGATFMKGCKAPDFMVATKDEAKKLEELFAVYSVVSAGNIAKLEKNFIDIIGPIGKMLIDSFYSDVGYRRGQDMPSLLYIQMIGKLKEELPIEDQTTFAARYAFGPALKNEP
jgi:hypothetical protein